MTIPTSVLVSGGFDPLHSGHCSYLKAAKELGDYLIVGLNSDEWLTRKKGQPFMSLEERMTIISNIKGVDEVCSFNDKDDSSCDLIETALKKYNNVIFANGGDRHNENTPEYIKYKDDDRVTFKWATGGLGKQNSSSVLLENWKCPKTERPWGYYRVLFEGEGFKVKELVIKPKHSLSNQRHRHRSETWNLVSGKAHVILHERDKLELTKNEVIHIPENTWHKGINDSDEPAHIIEVWKGETSKLTEEDIVRQHLTLYLPRLDSINTRNLANFDHDS